MFAPTGELVTSFARHGSKPGEFVTANGLAVGTNDILYVCDGFNDRIQFFK